MYCISHGNLDVAISIQIGASVPSTVVLGLSLLISRSCNALKVTLSFGHLYFSNFSSFPSFLFLLSSPLSSPTSLFSLLSLLFSFPLLSTGPSYFSFSSLHLSLFFSVLSLLLLSFCSLCSSIYGSVFSPSDPPFPYPPLLEHLAS